MKTYKAVDIAHALILKGINEGNLITQMKLQKILYFAQGYHLVNNKKPLFSDTIEASKYGPVITQVYDVCKLYGSSPIGDVWFFEKSINLNNINELDEFALNTTNFSWEILKRISNSALMNWIYTTDPWKNAYHDGGNGTPISNESIELYFKNFLIKNKNNVL